MTADPGNGGPEHYGTLRRLMDRWRVSRARVWLAAGLTSPRLILLAGIVLVSTGVLCLYLSDSVAHAGSWWQGTLDAFGVGFVVGGVVDATAISLLNQYLADTADKALRLRNREVEVLLGSARRHLNDAKSGHVNRDWLRATIQNLSSFIAREGDAVDLFTRDKLVSALQQLNGPDMADVVEASRQREDEFGRPLPYRIRPGDPES